jgi:hypothetical protein
VEGAHSPGPLHEKGQEEDPQERAVEEGPDLIHRLDEGPQLTSVEGHAAGEGPPGQGSQPGHPKVVGIGSFPCSSRS